MKNRIKTYLFFIGFIAFATLQAQEVNVEVESKFKKKSLEIGMNIAPLISQFIPFNNASQQRGPYTYDVRRLNAKGKGFRIGLGMDIDVNNNEINHFNFRIGYIKRKQLGNKWATSGGFDLALFAGGFNLPGDTNDEEAAVGFNLTRSIEYELFPKAYLATEMILFVGPSTFDGPIIKLIPPINIQFYVRL